MEHAPEYVSIQGYVTKADVETEIAEWEARGMRGV
jgi:hypothetical protein